MRQRVFLLLTLVFLFLFSSTAFTYDDPGGPDKVCLDTNLVTDVAGDRTADAPTYLIWGECGFSGLNSRNS